MRLIALVESTALVSTSTTSTEDSWNAVSIADGKGYMSGEPKCSEPARYTVVVP